MSIEENKALVRRFYEEIDQGNLEAMDELVAEDYVDHNPPPFPGLAAGREGLKQAFKMFWEATPGSHHIEEQIAETPAEGLTGMAVQMALWQHYNWDLRRFHTESDKALASAYETVVKLRGVDLATQVERW